MGHQKIHAAFQTGGDGGLANGLLQKPVVAALGDVLIHRLDQRAFLVSLYRVFMAGKIRLQGGIEVGITAFCITSLRLGDESICNIAIITL
ncbi:hypothetical protein FQZ97_1243480 [compost metagenome]